MPTDHGFCPIHRIAYHRSLDPNCPQCSVGRIVPPAQLDYDAVKKAPVDPTSGALLSAITLQPVV